MLKRLQIQHLILIENVSVDFESGLNVLSGETGSGKSAFMEALGLVLGERADTNLIRRGEEKGSVQALFDVECIPNVHQLLSDAGVEHDPKEELLIRREVHAVGKSRAWINHQMVHINFLRHLGKYLVQFSAQHANQQLLETDQHRQILDSYLGITPLTHEFATAWQQEMEIRKQLQELINGEGQRLRESEACQAELEEIRQARIKPGEEEELFAEYTRLTHAEELCQHAQSILNSLSGERQSILSLLNRQKLSFERLLRIDPSLEETFRLFQQATIELQEVGYVLQNYLGTVESHPGRSQEISERLSLLTRIKKKYGPTWEDVENYRKKTEQRFSLLDTADEQIKQLKSQLEQIQKINDELALQLTKLREEAAQALSKAIIEELRLLNMPKVDFAIRITQQKRSSIGDDFVEFYLAPNVGESMVPIKDCASGGELSRMMLALQVLLAGKEQTPTMVFDEMDANIGGETAMTVGEKLRALGAEHQVLCVTHFPQVALHAHHHLQISKQEIEGRTVTSIKVLGKKERKLELERMSGGKKRVT